MHPLIPALEHHRILPVAAGIGGTWICDPQLIRSKNWGEITRLGLEARNLATPKAPPL